MTELSPKAQALIWDAVLADMPSENDRARVRGKLVAQLGAAALVSSAAIATSAANAASIGAAAGGAAHGAAHGASAAMATATAASHAGVSAGTATATATLASGGLGIVAKTAIAAALVGAVGVGTVATIRSTPSSPTLSSQQQASRVEHSAPVTAAPKPVQEREWLTSEKVEKPNLVSRPRSRTQRQYALEHRRVAAKSRPTLDDELELLRSAQTSLRQENAQLALDTLDNHARKFPSGTLSQERDATRAIALCELNRLDQGRVVARRLLEKSPRSPLAARIYRSCGPLDE